MCYFLCWYRCTAVSTQWQTKRYNSKSLRMKNYKMMTLSRRFHQSFLIHSGIVNDMLSMNSKIPGSQPEPYSTSNKTNNTVSAVHTGLVNSGKSCTRLVNPLRSEERNRPILQFFTQEPRAKGHTCYSSHKNQNQFLISLSFTISL